MDAENTHQVFDWLWTSGQLSASDVAALPALGVSAVINLAPPTASIVLAGEAELVTAHGISYVQIPVDWAQPQPAHFFEFAAIMHAFTGRKVWVHCAKNMRVSAFIYLYRKLILAETEAIASYPMHAIWAPNETWQAFIHQVVAQASGDHDTWPSSGMPIAAAPIASIKGS